MFYHWVNFLENVLVCSAATIHQYTGEWWYFLSRYECRYYDKISQYMYYDSSWIKKSVLRNNCLLWLLTQVQVLSELCIKQRDLGKGRKVPSLPFIALCASGHVSVNMVAQKHAQFQLAVSWHSLVWPWTKHMVHLFLAALLCLSVICNDVSYHVSYGDTCIEICIVSWEIVSLQPFYCVILWSNVASVI